MHILSLDDMSRHKENMDMPKRMTPARYREAFCSRLKNLRESAGYTQKEVALELGIDKDTYAKYESRSLLPHHLITQVAELFYVDVVFLLSGHGRIIPKSDTRRAAAK